MRVLSLLPAATEIVAALGASDSLVGVTHECDWPPHVLTLPRVTRSAVMTAGKPGEVDAEVRSLSASGGSLFDLDEPLIRSLRPDVIVTQALCDVCAVSETDVRALATRLPNEPAIVTLNGSSLDSILDDVQRVSASLGRPATDLAQSLVDKHQRIHERLKAARAPRPRVAVIEWTDPLYSAGHWVPEMIRAAGGVDVLAKPGEHSRVVTEAEVRAAAPDILLIAPCGYDVGRAREEAVRLLSQPEWAWSRSIASWAVDSNAYLSRPGPRVWDGITLLASVLHPILFPAARDTDAVRL